jgi:hypothetical protein
VRNVARAVMVNVVAVRPQGPGNIRAWAPNRPEPNASILNYAQVPGLNLANGIVVPLCDEEAANPCSGNAAGVWARASGTAAVSAVLGEANGATGNNAGVAGVALSVTGTGVQGIASAGSGITRGVLGTTASPQGMGVLGTSFATSGVSVGVRGNTRAPDGIGVLGETLEATGNGIAVMGSAGSGAGYAGFFTGGRTTSRA